MGRLSKKGAAEPFPSDGAAVKKGAAKRFPSDGGKDVKKLFLSVKAMSFGRTALLAFMRRRILEKQSCFSEAQRFLKGIIVPQAQRLFKNNAAGRETAASPPPTLEATASDPFFNTQNSKPGPARTQGDSWDD